MSRTRSLCSEDCGYRPLYEGSQSSLSDMAAKQSAAHSRVNRLREGIVTALKRAMPAEVSEVEIKAGRRLSEMDDELILSYLEAFLAAAAARPPAATSGRAAPADTRGTPPAPPADAVAAHSPTADTAATPTPSATPPGAAPPRDTGAGPWPPEAGSVPTDGGAARPGEVLFSGVLPSDVAPDDDGAWVDEWIAASEDRGPETDSGWDRPGPYPGGPGAAKPRRSLTDAARGHAPPPAAGPSAPAGLTVVAPPRGPQEPARLSEGVWESDDLSDLFAAEAPTGIPTRIPTGSPAADDPFPGAGHGSHRVALPAGEIPEAGPQGDGLCELIAIFDEHRGPGAEAADSGTGPSAQGSAVAPVSQVEAVSPGGPQRGSQGGSPVRAAADTATAPVTAAVPGAQTAGAPRGRPAAAVQPPLRPEMLRPAGRKARTGVRVPRTSAAPPDAFDVPPELSDSGGELTDAVRQALLAAVSVPRPVFVSDLEAVAGHRDLVQAWTSECHASGVRVIPAKARHRLRGALLVPPGLADSGGSRKSVWANCTATYRGAKLYEMGVLLQRVGDDVISHRLREHTALLRVAAGRGLTGVIVSMDPEPATGTTAGDAVLADLEELMSERLSLAVIVSVYADGLDKLKQTVSSEALARRWAPTFPVTVGRSWEFAASGEAASDLVLGG